MKIKFFKIYIRLAMVVLTAVSHALGQTQSSTATTNRTSASTTSTSIKTTPLATFTLKTEVYQNAQKANTTGGAQTEDTIKAILNISPDLGVGILFGGFYEIANSTQTQSDIRFNDADFALVVTGKSSGLLVADSAFIEGRLYLPTSPSSKSIGQAYRVRMDLTLTNNLGNGFSAGLYFRPNYFTMNNDSNYSSYFESLTSVFVTYNITSKFNVYSSLDHNYDSVDKNRTSVKTDKEGLGPQIGAEYKWNSAVKLSIDAEQTRNINEPSFYSPRKEYALFDANDTVYRFKGTFTY